MPNPAPPARPLAWLAANDRGWLLPDCLAGITLAAYAVPVALAYATLAGLAPEVGIYGYLLGGLGYAVVGSILLLLHRAAAPHVAVLGRIPGTTRFSDLERNPDNERTHAAGHGRGRRHALPRPLPAARGRAALADRDPGPL